MPSTTSPLDSPSRAFRSMALGFLEASSLTPNSCLPMSLPPTRVILSAAAKVNFTALTSSAGATLPSATISTASQLPFSFCQSLAVSPPWTAPNPMSRATDTQNARGNLMIQPPLMTSSIPMVGFICASELAANDRVQQRGLLQIPQTSERRDAGPVCCNGWFGGDPTAHQGRFHSLTLPSRS